MIIPISNPQRPPKKWWDHTVKALKPKAKDPEAVAGWIWYHHMTPNKKKEVLLTEKYNTRDVALAYTQYLNAGRTRQPKESLMSATRRRRSFRAFRIGAPRRNPKRKVRKTARKAAPVARKSSSSTMSRPRVYKRAGKWYRSKRSRLFTGPTMLNPRRKSRRRRNPMTMAAPMSSVVRRNRKRRRNLSVYSNRRRPVRRNPLFRGGLKGMFSKTVLMTVGKAGAGIAVGYLTMPLVYKILPANMKASARPYLGGIHAAAGILMAGLLKNKLAKELGMYIAATGVYDLIAMNIPQLGLPSLPTGENVLTRLIPGTVSAPVSASYPIPIAPVSPVARVGVSASYQSPVRAGYSGSYQAPDMRTEGLGSDNPYSDIEGFDG